MATANFYVKPTDGWVAITSTPVDFIRVRAYPDDYIYFITSSSSTPSDDFSVDPAIAASGSVTISGGLPAANGTVTINGTVFTFVAEGDEVADTDVVIGADEDETGENLAAAINAVLSSFVTAANAAGVVTVTANFPGVGGNSNTLAENATNTTVSGSKFTGGADPVYPTTLGYRVDCEDFWVDVPSGSEYYYVRSINPANGQPGGLLRLDVFTIETPTP